MPTFPKDVERRRLLTGQRLSLKKVEKVSFEQNLKKHVRDISETSNDEKFPIPSKNI